MKINELKVGDRVKYNTPDWMFEYNDKLEKIMEGCISYIGNNPPDLITIGALLVPKKNIISKLELIKKGCKCGNCRPNKYKEIPIEKENLFNGHPYICPQCHKSHGVTGVWRQGLESKYCQTCIDSWDKIDLTKLPTPVTTYHCPKCDKQLWGTCGMPIKQYAHEPCKECQDKLNKNIKVPEYDILSEGYDPKKIKKKDSEPKSFKFELSPIKMFSIDYNNEYHSWWRRSFGGTLTITFDMIKFLDNNSYPFNTDKTYIVEIKEKE